MRDKQRGLDKLDMAQTRGGEHRHPMTFTHRDHDADHRSTLTLRVEDYHEEEIFMPADAQQVHA